MLLIVVRDDETEEAYEVANNTSLRRCLRDDYWFIRPTSGGQIAIHKDQVDEVRLGAIEFADDRGRLSAEADSG